MHSLRQAIKVSLHIGGMILILSCAPSDLGETLSSEGSLHLAYFPHPDFYTRTEVGVKLLYPFAAQELTNFMGVPIDWSSILARYDGFSPVQPILLKTKSQCPRLPSPGEESFSTSDTSPVLLWDPSQRERLPWFGEPGEDPRFCILYPLEGFSSPGEAFVGVTPELGDVLVERGIFSPPPPELAEIPFALTFSFPVGSRRNRVQDLYAMRGATERWLREQGGRLLLTRITDPKESFVANYPGKLFAWKGTYRVPWFLGPKGDLYRDSEGNPLLSGESSEQFFVIVPTRVTAESTIPLVQYGHGLFGDPREIWYLDQQNLIRSVGGIFAAVPWGMAIRYFHRAAAALLDPNEILLLRDMVFQGIINQMVFTYFYRTELKDLLSEALGRPVSDEVDFIGISQGAILGAVLLALDPYLRRGVLHVGGGGWTPMMTHSSNWKRAEGLGYGDAIRATIPSATTRTILYALWQSIWDQWDPVIYAHYWHRVPEPGLTLPHPLRQVYYAYAIADPQVPNFSSETVIRTTGMPLLTPAVTQPYGILFVPYPGSFTQAAAQWDVGPGEPAHSEPRKLNEFGFAVRTFLRTGELVDPCRGRPCRFRLTPEPELLP